MAVLYPIMELDHLDIIPSYKCSTANCIDCSQKSDNNYSKSCTLTLDLNLLFPFLVDYVMAIKVSSFGLFGGECTEYDQCSELVELLTREFPGIRLEIVTNGQNPRRVRKLIKAAGTRYNLIIEFSVDGYGGTCDQLRGKQGYFEKAMLSIEEMIAAGLGANVRLNTRYYPEHEESLIKLRNFLSEQYGITRDQISLQNLTIIGRPHEESIEYMSRLRHFAEKFWANSLHGEIARTHPKHRHYCSRVDTIFCVPGIQPDGYLYTCNSYNKGIRIGHIGNANVHEMFATMLNIARLAPDHCEKCLFGQCVRLNYQLMSDVKM